MIELCCSEEIYSKYMGGAEKSEKAKGTLTYEEVRKKHLNTYTTTTTAIIFSSCA